MFAADALEKVLLMYGQYYQVRREGAAEPFAAEAESTVTDELLSGFKTVKVGTAISREIVFFAAEEALTAQRAQQLADRAWEEGLSRVQPGPEHRNTDIILILLTDSLPDEAAAVLKKLRRSKNFKFTFHGWSVLRLIAIETPSGKLVHNRMGQDLKKLFSNIKF